MVGISFAFDARFESDIVGILGHAARSLSQGWSEFHPRSTS